MALTAPNYGYLTNDTTPDLSWNAVAYGESYQLQISRNYTFTDIAQDVGGIAGVTTTASALADGLYYWRVRAMNANSVYGAWSAYRYFTIDTTPPASAGAVEPG